MAEMSQQEQHTEAQHADKVHFKLSSVKPSMES